MQTAASALSNRADSSSSRNGEFMAAIAAGDTETMQRCLDQGANLDDTFEFVGKDLSPLHLACALGKLDSVKFLLNARANFDQQSSSGESPLFVAAINGHVPVVDHLINLQVDVDCQSNTGDSPLFAAAKNGHQKVVDSLIKAQANVDALNLGGESPVHIASQNGHKKVIERLIKGQADVNFHQVPLVGGSSPLHLASQQGNLEVVKCLVNAKANLDLHNGTGNTALHTAIDSAHNSVVRELIKANADVNLKDRRHGSVPLHIAALDGNESIVTDLLTSFADINAQRISGATSLYVASHSGNSQIVNCLIKAQADVNLQRSTGETPLYAASFYGHKSVVDALILAKADVSLREAIDGASPLYIALQNGHHNVVDSLLKAQADIDFLTKFDSTPLYLAAQNAQTKAVDLLIKSQANVDLKALNGETAIHTASQNGHKLVVDALIKAQADLNICDSIGETAIHSASQNGHVPVVDSLIKAGAHVNLQKCSGETPLHAASLHGHYEVAKVLIEAHADVNLRKVSGESALYIAADGGHNRIVQLLIEAKANFDQQRNTGETALNIASQNKHLEVVKALIEARADVNLQTDDGCPPIFIAAQNGHSEAVDLLIKAQADVNLQASAGEVALHIACQNGHLRVVDLLIKAQADVDILTNSGVSPFYCAIRSANQEIVDLLTDAQANCDIIIDEEDTIIKIPPLLQQRHQAESMSGTSDDEFGSLSDIEQSVLKFVMSGNFIDANLDDQDNDEDRNTDENESELALSDSALSLELHSALAQSGFTDSRSALQISVAEVLQEILRNRLNHNGLFIVGSYSEGWGNNLKTVDGRTDIESDIDMMRLIPGKLYHPVGVCECQDAVEKQEFYNGHIICSGYASNPSEASFGSNLRPAVDHVVASRLCRYPDIAPLQPNILANSNIPQSVLQSLQFQITASDSSSPCHVVHAASPGRGGEELRVSTSFLEKQLLRSLNTVQGQLFVTLKYLVKKVIAHKSGFDAQGVKPYHVKTITFRMLEKTSPQEWRPDNLVHLIRQSLQMLIDSIESSIAPGNVHGRVMDHFFLNDAALYLKGVGGEADSMQAALSNIANTLRTVTERLPELLIKFKSYLKLLNESARFYFHPFLILPIIGSNTVSESCSNGLKYHEIPDVVRRCLLLLSQSDCNKKSRDSLMQLVDRLPDCARSAREALRALTCLKFGDFNIAARMLRDCQGHEVSRGIDWPIDKSASEATVEAVWHHLNSCDSAWKFCLPFSEKPVLQFLSEGLIKIFPLQMGLNSASLFYVNFDALLWALRLELRTESQDVFANWIEDTAEREDADEQELLVARNYCQDHQLKIELSEKLKQLELKQFVRPN